MSDEIKTKTLKLPEFIPVNIPLALLPLNDLNMRNPEVRERVQAAINHLAESPGFQLLLEELASRIEHLLWVYGLDDYIEACVPTPVSLVPLNYKNSADDLTIAITSMLLSVDEVEGELGDKFEPSQRKPKKTSLRVLKKK